MDRLTGLIFLSARPSPFIYVFIFLSDQHDAFKKIVFILPARFKGFLYFVCLARGLGTGPRAIPALFKPLIVSLVSYTKRKKMLWVPPPGNPV